MSYYLVRGVEEGEIREYLYRAPSPGKAVRAVGDDYPSLDIRKVRRVRRGVVAGHYYRSGGTDCHYIHLQERKRFDVHVGNTHLVDQLRHQNGEVLLVIDGRGYVESWYPLETVSGEGSYYGRSPSLDLVPDEDDDFGLGWEEDDEGWELEDDSEAYALAHEEWSEEGWG